MNQQKSFLTKLTKASALLALAVAILTANSTCICFSCQPKEPDAMKRFKQK